MPDITQIAASLATPSLASALQQAAELLPGQVIEAKVAQILADGIVRLISPQGAFDLRASHPALQVGTSVRIVINPSGAVTLTVLPQRENTAPAAPLPRTPQADPAVITTIASSSSLKVSELLNLLAEAENPSPASSWPNAEPSNPAASEAAPPSRPPSSAAPAASLAETTSPPLAAAPSPPQAVPAPEPQASSFLSGIISQALEKQDGFVPLFANLNHLAQSPPQNLPPALRAAIDQVLQAHTAPEAEIAPEVIEQAVVKSGLFLENRLAQGLPPASPAQTPAGSAPIADLKAALLNLTAVLNKLADDDSLPAPSLRENTDRAVPPQRGAMPVAQESAAPTLPSRAPISQIIQVLMPQAEAALSRMRLLQLASQPIGGGVSMQSDQPGRLPQSWIMDIPLSIQGQIAIMQMQIEREAARREALVSERHWRVRFALDLDGLGPVHALLALGSGMLGVTLWAERPATFQLFKDMADELRSSLSDNDIEITEVELRSGSPKQARAPAGSLVDTRT